MPASESQTTVLKIATRLQAGLRIKMGLNSSNCYLAAVAEYIEGSPPRVFQIVPGAASPDDANGSQDGGGVLFRTMTWDIVLWRRLATDQASRSADVLVREGLGVLDDMENLHAVLGHTYLGDLLVEPIFYVGESDTTWFDEKRKIVRRSQTWRVKWARTIPSTLTLVESDFDVASD
jgi:hypothetical protein